MTSIFIDQSLEYFLSMINYDFSSLLSTFGDCILDSSQPIIMILYFEILAGVILFPFLSFTSSCSISSSYDYFHWKHFGSLIESYRWNSSVIDLSCIPSSSMDSWSSFGYQWVEVLSLQFYTFGALNRIKVFDTIITELRRPSDNSITGFSRPTGSTTWCRPHLRVTILEALLPPNSLIWLFSFLSYFIYPSRPTFFVLPFQYFYPLYPCFFFKGPIHLIEVYTGSNPYPSYHIYYYPTLLIVIFFLFLFLVGLAPQ